MSNNSDTNCCYRVCLKCGYVSSCRHLSLYIIFKSNDIANTSLSIAECESYDSKAGDTADLCVDICDVVPSMGALRREERRFRQVIASSLLSNASLGDMANACCISVSTFKRRFRARYSVSPHSWLLSQRLRIAHTLVVTTTLHISDLAAICGFRNTSHFISQFRRRYSITPMHLRASAAASSYTEHDGEVVVEIVL